MKAKILSAISLLLMLCILVACAPSNLPDAETNLGDTPEDSFGECGLPNIESAVINGKELSEFTIVYSGSEDDYNKRAAEYIQKMIKEKANLDLPIVTDTTSQAKYEIVVGETSRDISKQLDANTTGVQFAILADDDQIALEGDHFVIAAAA